MNCINTDLSALFDWTPRPETENAAPAGTGNGVETSAALEIALQKHTESAPENQAWAALDAAPQWCVWREERRGDNPPETAALTRQKLEGLRNVEAWWHDRLS